MGGDSSLSQSHSDSWRQNSSFWNEEREEPVAGCFISLTFRLYPNFSLLVFIVSTLWQDCCLCLFSLCVHTCYSSYVEVRGHSALVCPSSHQMDSGFPTQVTRPGQAWQAPLLSGPCLQPWRFLDAQQVTLGRSASPRSVGLTTILSSFFVSPILFSHSRK